MGDLGAALSAALVVIGDRLGLYRAMRSGEPVSAEQLAERTGTDPRYVREWLSNQAAGGYVTYDPDGEEFFLSPEQSFALAQEGSPAFIPGAFQVATAAIKDEEKIERAFQSGDGVGWHEHHHDLFAGTERFFRPGYAANLVSSWIPALDGVQAKLERRRPGRRRRLRSWRLDDADGAGVPELASSSGSTITARRSSTPVRPPSTPVVDDRVRFEVASAKEYPGGPYELVAMFDCLHDMGDPVGAAAHVPRHARRPTGPG